MVTAGLPESWPFIGLTDEWYESEPIPWLDGEYAVARARTPWVRWYFDRGYMGEHARWALDLSVKYDRPKAWKFWTVKDLEPAIGMRFFRIGLLDRIGGSLLTAVALYAAARESP